MYIKWSLSGKTEIGKDHITLGRDGVRLLDHLNVKLKSGNIAS